MGIDYKVYDMADEALRLARRANDNITSLSQTLATLITTLGPAATLALMQGTTSPEGVVTGHVAWQQYFQYNVSGDVIATWRFEGTIGQNTGWVEV